MGASSEAPFRRGTVMILLPISTRQSPMQTGSLLLNEIAIWLKSHCRNGCRYERKEKALPVLDEYFKWIRSFDSDHIIKGKSRGGIVYSQNQEKELYAFLLDESCS